MKASELIEELKKKIEEHGDVDVAIFNWDQGGTDDVDGVIHRKGEIVIL